MHTGIYIAMYNNVGIYGYIFIVMRIFKNFTVILSLIQNIMQLDKNEYSQKFLVFKEHIM